MFVWNKKKYLRKLWALQGRQFKRKRRKSAKFKFLFYLVSGNFCVEYMSINMKSLKLYAMHLQAQKSR